VREGQLKVWLDSQSAKITALGWYWAQLMQWLIMVQFKWVDWEFCLHELRIEDLYSWVEEFNQVYWSGLIFV